MESEKKQRLVIDGNAFYEIDLKCLEEKKKKQEAAKVKTTRLAGGLLCPYKGLFPACARKAH